MKNMYLYLLGISIFILTACSTVNKDDGYKSDLLQYVDPFIGTGFHGHTFPGAVVPHGRVQLSPDTHLFGWEASSGYHYQDTTLYGFSHTHLSGTGIGDMGDFLFLPFTGSFPDEKPIGHFSHDKESAQPGYYQVMVQPWKVNAELSATKRTGWHKYSFPEQDEACVMIDLSHILQSDWGHRVVESEIALLDEYTVIGYRLTSGWAAEDPVWFRCVFDQPILNHQIRVNNEVFDGKEAEGKNLKLYLSFGKLDKTLNASVGISAVDVAGAELNLSEVDGYTSIEQVIQSAQKEWRSELDKVVIDTKNQAVLTNFYTAMYHSKIAPMLYSDLDGRYRGIDQKIHQSNGKDHYTVYSLWDVFRSWYPLMTIIEPERARDWAYDLLDHQEKGGLLPKWPLNGNYTGTMVGYPAVAILADAMQKGLLDSIPEVMLAAAVKSSQWQPEFKEKHKGTRAENVMTEHIYYKEKMGYVPVDKCAESVSYGLEMAYYDWCIAVMAQRVGNADLAEQYYEKGKAYKYYFDTQTQFMRGKKADGSWDEEFNPRFSDHLKSEFVEGNAWQWTPFVPHAIDELADLMGGKEKLGVWLDSLFTTSSVIEGDNASADITGLIGQYAHGNEPSHHVPYMYQYTDRPWRTQEVLDSVLYHFYKPTPEGIIGNEDCGQMSAWYVLNALGIYQVTPGNDEFRIGRPIVDKAQLAIGDGFFTISVINNSVHNKYVQKVELNGIELETQIFNYDDFREGGELKIYMSEKRDS